MHYDTLGMVVMPGAERAEEMIPTLSYRQLVDSLGLLTEMGVLEEGSLPMMLVVARLMDRRRIVNSGMASVELRQGLENYRRASRKNPVHAVESALQQAMEVARQAEWMRLELEDKAESTANSAR